MIPKEYFKIKNLISFPLYKTTIAYQEVQGIQQYLHQSMKATTEAVPKNVVARATGVSKKKEEYSKKKLYSKQSHLFF